MEARCSASKVRTARGNGSSARAKPTGDISIKLIRLRIRCAASPRRSAMPCCATTLRLLSVVHVSYSSSRLDHRLSLQSEGGGCRSSDRSSAMMTDAAM